MAERTSLRHSKPNTKRNYRTEIVQYFDFLEITPEVYTPDIDQLEMDIARFAEHLEKKNFTPKTVLCKINAISSYLKCNRITIDRNFIKGLGVTGSVLTNDRIPKKEGLQSIE
jgi:hypothetical protein